MVEVNKIVNKIRTADEARTLMENAMRLGRYDVYLAAFRRYNELNAGDHTIPSRFAHEGGELVVPSRLKEFGKRVGTPARRRGDG